MQDELHKHSIEFESADSLLQELADFKRTIELKSKNNAQYESFVKQVNVLVDLLEKKIENKENKEQEEFDPKLIRQRLIGLRQEFTAIESPELPETALIAQANKNRELLAQGVEKDAQNMLQDRFGISGTV